MGRSRDAVVGSGHGTREPAQAVGTGTAQGTATQPAPGTATSASSASADPEVLAGTAAEVLGGYLHERAAEFLRGLRDHAQGTGAASGASGPGPGGASGTADPARAAASVETLRGAARRLHGALITYRSLLDPVWADDLRTELSWLAGALASEYAYAARLERLLGALHRLASGGGTGREGEAPPGEAGARPSGSSAATPSGTAGRAGGTGQSVGGGSRGGAATRERGALPVGAARAGALLERRLTLSRTRAHSAALQALGSARFHAVADAVALLASEAPFRPGGEAADRPAAAVLPPLADQARRKLTEAVAALPLSRAEAPYNADALARSLGTEARQDAAWDHVRVLLRLHRYAQEVLGPCAEPDPRLGPAGEALERHRDAAAAAAAAASAAATPRIAPATAYALGVLHADQRHEVEAARFAFGHHWREGGPL
ncbi:CHAD domain-containing protein [Streptomyces smyrnaeus]|uniref:CHAD domain-containing protein n=1 Tax=Streptomyces smyrnaeus TaxID=1387713 RepID=A0ABS3Y581_9ACTN|nr:CHAD domain-containing protein [Streptomyces smyrnaeus]MBO8202820.1 CHAD domain-containing protein [Streptomyces smyrnaeus]